MERGRDCCFCLSRGGADATFDCGLRRWPEVGFGEIAIDLPQARFWMAKPKTTCVMNVVSPISCDVRCKSRQHSSIFHCSEPVPARLKEWAYAGFAINLASALIAHLSVGGGTGVLWGLSYFCWRRLQAMLARA
jgi:hypothetical protein